MVQRQLDEFVGLKPPTTEMRVDQKIFTDSNDERTACIYQIRLVGVPDDHPLYQILYIGQAVRVGTPKKVVNARWDEEIYQAKKEDKQLGLLAVLDQYDKDAFEFKLLEHRIGPIEEVQTWANQREKYYIDANGGVLRNMDKRLHQTLNLTKGGKGIKWWYGQLALRNGRLAKFKTELHAYVDAHGTSLVPRNYVTDNGYKLGEKLMSFRQGHLRTGMPDEDNINAWAEALPHWAWNAHKTDAFRDTMATVASAAAQTKRKAILDKLSLEKRVKQENEYARKDRNDAKQKARYAAYKRNNPTATWRDYHEHRRSDFTHDERKAAHGAANAAARIATAAKKRKAMLDSLSPEKRVEKAKQYATTDCNTAKRKVRLEAYKRDNPNATWEDYWEHRRQLKEK